MANEENWITYDQFYVVYGGKLSESWKNRKAAFKHFDYRKREEFLNELKFISSFNHENIIPFIGYCDEDNKMIIVYEYMSCQWEPF